MTVRRLQVTDFDAFLALIAQFRPTSFTAAEFEQQLAELDDSGAQELWVMESEGALIGSFTLIVERKFIFQRCRLAHVEDVIVDQHHRRRGVGTRLLEAAKQRAAELGCYKITLVCARETMPFYEHVAFEARGVQMSQLVPMPSVEAKAE